MFDNKGALNARFSYVRREDLVSVVRHGRRRDHVDRCVQYTHQMSEDGAEASARTLARIVPLIYGGLFGAFTENMYLGFSLGLMLTLALDLRMGDKSLSLPLLRPLINGSCRLFQRGYSV